jgi:UDP-sugar pyrophosphorylase
MEDLQRSLTVLSDPQKALVRKLCSLGQSHLFAKWPCNTSPTSRRKLATQLQELDEAYADGGLEGYINNAKRLLSDSREGVNPLEGWEPSVPEGERFDLGTKEFEETESTGRPELGKVGFVLVAGGLGERLGYSSIKVGLPTEMATETCYLQYYIEYILAVQVKYGEGKRLPLCIMTSGDTNEKTAKLLRKNNYFGMQKSQITIVQQGQGVPALMDNNAKMVLEENDSSKIVTKPHGHGDVHALLYTHGVAKRWLSDGIEWLTLFQDTNGLAFHTLPLMLGVSKKLDLIMNSLAVPRKAKQAIGGIAKLKHQTTGEYKTLNVEYNQLDPLLRATGNLDGDVNDEKTGYSPFPGNINQLLFKLDAYSDALNRTKGLMPEFVNPKYKDDAKTVFKKPTRLECMMQDFPTILEGEDAKRVGFTSVSADLCFSPVKNATSDGAELQAQNTQPGTAASGEADQFGAVRKILVSLGCHVETASEETYAGIQVVPGPAIVIKPNAACCPGEYHRLFPTPDKVKISANSTLIVRGSEVTIESLDLDGTLVVDADENKSIVVKDKIVKNEGWVKVADDSSDDEIIKMRGYYILRKEADWIEEKNNSCAIL